MTSTPWRRDFLLLIKAGHNIIYSVLNLFSLPEASSTRQLLPVFPECMEEAAWSWINPLSTKNLIQDSSALDWADMEGKCRMTCQPFPTQPCGIKCVWSCPPAPPSPPERCSVPTRGHVPQQACRGHVGTHISQQDEEEEGQTCRELCGAPAVSQRHTPVHKDAPVPQSPEIINKYVFLCASKAQIQGHSHIC